MLSRTSFQRASLRCHSACAASICSRSCITESGIVGSGTGYAAARESNSASRSYGSTRTGRDARVSGSAPSSPSSCACTTISPPHPADTTKPAASSNTSRLIGSISGWVREWKEKYGAGARRSSGADVSAWSMSAPAGADHALLPGVGPPPRGGGPSPRGEDGAGRGAEGCGGTAQPVGREAADRLVRRQVAVIEEELACGVQCPGLGRGEVEEPVAEVAAGRLVEPVLGQRVGCRPADEVFDPLGPHVGAVGVDHEGDQQGAAGAVALVLDAEVVDLGPGRRRADRFADAEGEQFQSGHVRLSGEG